MKGRFIPDGSILAFLLAIAPIPDPRPAYAQVPATAEAPGALEGRLRGEVARLASPEFAGRRGDGARKAAAHLVDEFRALGLDPLFDGAFEQPIPGDAPGKIQGRNVGGRLVGSDPQLRDDWVVVSAHYDHLGVRGGVLYPGADDNASGVAMMLEVARAARGPEKPRRSVMFIGFDLEEVGLFGSRYLAEHPPVPLGRIKLFITADMIGRSLGDVCGSYVFVMGTENAPGLRPWIASSARDEPVTVGILGSDILLLNRSDYGPFRARKVPYLFFSTGENPHYHSPTDTPETLDYAKIAAISRLILGVVRHAADADAGAIPPWSSAPDSPVAEAVTVRDVLKILLDRRTDLKITPAQILLMNNAVRSLDGIVARGAITSAERSTMVNVVRIVLFSLF